MVANEELLPQAVLRQIGDKLYEKRKMAALEVEQIVKRLAGAGDTSKISAIIDKLIAEFAFSPQANHRKVRVWGRWGGVGLRAEQQQQQQQRRQARRRWEQC
jgi:vacuole morphology and inheritance protein 14